MRNNPLGAVVRHLRMRAGAAADAASPDAQLLRRFIENRDETAFAEIVRRHGPLVWALCRSSLQTVDAEDAFQATFIVLARRAAGIRKRASLACWLSGVSRRVVAAARKRLAKQPSDLPIDVQAAGSEIGDRTRLEWREVLNQEMDQLPEKYRLPTLLCYYQGLTNEEAAARLGWPHGTVCGRLARARELLRRRLGRRGVTLGTGALAVHVAGPPSDLIAATFGACAGLTGARSIGIKLTNSALNLAAGAIHTMLLEKIRVWSIGTVGLVALGSAAGWVMVPANGQSVQPPSPAVARPNADASARPAPPQLTPEALAAELDRLHADALKPSPLGEVAPTDDELQKLRKQCYQSAHAELTNRFQAFQAGTTQGTIDVLLDCIVRRLLTAELSLSVRPDDKLAAYSRSLSILKWVESVNEVRFQAGRITIQDLEQTRFERLNMEIKVVEAKRTGDLRESPVRR